MVLAFVLLPCTLRAQDKVVREVEIHRNVKLVQLGVDPQVPDEMVKQYQSFLPILEDSLKESTTDQSDECFLTVRVAAGMKEVGSAKTKRPLARISAFRRNSRQEYQGNFILYSYSTAGPVNKEETSFWLKKQILDPVECRKSAE
ncbi:MAG: hypothetical protein H6Q07_2657 [Acidobacteria bacterium]|nr:hypothetical protein [Acidobacteriota bacterium]